MYSLKGHKPVKLEGTTFADLGMKESDVEEILRKNVDMVCDDEESMLIVGQQVKNVQNGRSDLTAIDNNGNLVLIEIKRDKKDIEARKEAFEFQAIRYAANCATIKSTDILVQDVFAPYVEKHKSEFSDTSGLTSSEIAQRQLKDFTTRNEIKQFNEQQRIILVASDFDAQTLSAVAWLNSNQVDIACFQICLYQYESNVFFDMKKILPIVTYEDYYVSVSSKSSIAKGEKKDISRRTLPKIDTLMEWQIVKAGDILVAKGTDREAVLQPNGQVKMPGEQNAVSIQQWLRKVFGWDSVQTYAFTVDKKTNKTLSDLRQEYMEKRESEGEESI